MVPRPFSPTVSPDAGREQARHAAARQGAHRHATRPMSSHVPRRTAMRLTGRARGRRRVQQSSWRFTGRPALDDHCRACGSAGTTWLASTGGHERGSARRTALQPRLAVPGIAVHPESGDVDRPASAAARYQVGDHAPGAGRHRPAERAVPVASSRLSIGRAADDGRAVGRHRAQAAPEGRRVLTSPPAGRGRSPRVPACRGAIRAALAVARQFSRAADADAVPQARHGHLVRLVHDGGFGRARGIGDGHRDRVALDRVDGQARPSGLSSLGE